MQEKQSCIEASAACTRHRGTAHTRQPTATGSRASKYSPASGIAEADPAGFPEIDERPPAFADSRGELGIWLDELSQVLPALNFVCVRHD